MGDASGTRPPFPTGDPGGGRVPTSGTDEETGWFPRNLGLFVLPFLAGYFARRRRLALRGSALTAVPFVLAALVVNVYPYRPGSGTELLVAAHLPVFTVWAATVVAVLPPIFVVR